MIGKEVEEKKIELNAGGKVIGVKPARTKLNGMRNWSIREAKKMVEADPGGKDKGVEIKWLEKPRRVTLEGVTVFSQNKWETGGTFEGPMAHLYIGEGK